MSPGDVGRQARAPSRAALVVVLVLLVGTVAAFAYTERQKLAGGLITEPRATHFFSPVCACETAVATVRFRLRRAETVTVRIERPNGRLVRTLASRERFAAGRVQLEWDGRTESGELAHDGIYRVAVVTAGEDTPFLFPQRIALDTVVPSAMIIRVRPSSISPGETVLVAFELSEAGRPILSVDGVEVLEGRRGKRGKLEWDGQVGGAPAPPGTYQLTIAGLDPAGNVGPASAPAAVAVGP